MNGQIRQYGDLAQHIWRVPEAIAHLTTMYELFPGDLMFTGTPADVGPIQRGDVITGGVENIAEIEITVV